MTKQTLRVGLLGAGVFGGYHAGKLAQNARVDFIGVYDPHLDKRKTLAEKHGGRHFETEESLFAACDAMVLANPAVNHGASALAALEAGCHILVEKPLATSVKDAKAVWDLSKELNKIVQVGHQERYVIRAIGLDKVTETPQKIIATRNATFSRRGGDTSVTLDLMSHDIDLCCMLMRGTPIEVSGASERVNTGNPDRARAELTFEGGTAILSASRVEDTVSRSMTIQYPSGTVLIDFGAKTVQHNTGFDLDMEFASNPIAADSLGAASSQFIDAVLDGTPVNVTAEEGYNAAKVAIQIDGEPIQ
jgi:predicted dehydrogenase